jgi:N-acetylmuramic acid 6-phosphate (MurNAc-6-P) etherase
LMIRLGHVRGNKMVDMKLSNVKLIDRGVRMVKTELIQYLSNQQGIDVNDFEAKYSNETIEQILLEKDSVRAAADHIMKEFQSDKV